MFLTQRTGELSGYSIVTMGFPFFISADSVGQAISPWHHDTEKTFLTLIPADHVRSTGENHTQSFFFSVTAFALPPCLRSHLSSFIRMDFLERSP